MRGGAQWPPPDGGSGTSRDKGCQQWGAVWCSLSPEEMSGLCTINPLWPTAPCERGTQVGGDVPSPPQPPTHTHTHTHTQSLTLRVLLLPGSCMQEGIWGRGRGGGYLGWGSRVGLAARLNSTHGGGPWQAPVPF